MVLVGTSALPAVYTNSGKYVIDWTRLGGI